MSKKPANLTINLVPKDPFFETALGKTLRWALSVGRYIVIFTELVVIVSFATRFTLDRQVTDLNDSIHQKESVIKSYGDLEPKVRSVQMKIEQYQQIEQQVNIVDVFPQLSAITPRDVKLTELVMRPNNVSLEGTTLSQNSLNTLINNVQLTPSFLNVVIDKIETNKEQGAGFTFRIRFDTREVQRANNTQAPAENVRILDRTQGL